VLVALSLEFEQQLSAAEVEAAVSRIEHEIKSHHPEVTRVFIEAQRRDAHRRSQGALVEA
jgi:divalent metal cation (Fe/Co/Zn/Cd) transporter